MSFWIVLVPLAASTAHAKVRPAPNHSFGLKKIPAGQPRISFSFHQQNTRFKSTHHANRILLPREIFQR
jgi:hypothetical protein